MKQQLTPEQTKVLDLLKTHDANNRGHSWRLEQWQEEGNFYTKEQWEELIKNLKIKVK